MDDPDGGARKRLGLEPSDKTMVGVLVALVVILIVAAIGVATVRDAQHTVQRATSTTTSTNPPGDTGAPVTRGRLSDQQRRTVDEVKAQVAAIRGLAWQRDLPVKVVSREELSRKITELNAKEIAKTRDELTAGESVLKLLQLIPHDLNYVKTIDALLAGAVLGFYDDETQELYVGGAGTIDVATRSVLAHELTHALTDQAFGFGAATKALDDQNKSEESAAYSAVIEGDAELVRTMWEQKHLSSDQRAEAARGSSDDTGTYDNVPPYLVRSLRFPYDAGSLFVRTRFRAGGFAEVDNAYRKPPTSTEQILHPDLYASGQGWTAPPLPDLAAVTGCAKVDNGTLGEFDMGEVLDEQLSATDARKAAAGWNGDAYGVVRCGAAVGFAQRWQTDAPADANRLTDALARWSRGWSGTNKAPDATGRFSGPNGSGRLSTSPGRVELILADDLPTADRLSAALG